MYFRNVCLQRIAAFTYKNNRCFFSDEFARDYFKTGKLIFKKFHVLNVNVYIYISLKMLD